MGQFTQQLLDHAVARGVTIKARHTVRALRPDDRGVTLELAQRPVREAESRFDAAVICAGAASARLLRSVGMRVPLVPVHGYSITAALRPSADPLVENTPRAGLMDEAYKVAITRIGDRLRVAGSAELGGRVDRLSPLALATLYKVLEDWFPSGVDHARAVPWKGARPMLPDGPPVIGATRHARLWSTSGTARAAGRWRAAARGCWST